MLVTEEKLKDLGRIKFGQVYKFNYKLTNVGDKEVNIRKLSVSCSSCTSASSSISKVKPGEDVIINVTFTPGTVSKQKKHIDVLYDDTGLRLEFVAESHG
jgi:hypothetical protein